MRSRAGRAEAQGEDAAYGGVAKLSGPAAEVRDIGVFLQREKGFRRARSLLFNEEGDGFPSPDHQ